MNEDSLTNLRAALKQRGWTQELIALELGRTQGHISHVLSGRRESGDLLRKIKGLSRRQARRGEAVA